MIFTRPMYYEIIDGRIWSVDAAAFLVDPATDGAYQDYLAAGGKAIKAPDIEGVNSAQGLYQALKFYGFPLGSLEPEDEKKQRLKAHAQKKASAILDAVAQRQIAQIATFTNEEYKVLADAEIFPVWAAGESYVKDERIQHKGIVYQVVQDVTAIENQPPDLTGMLAIYRPLSEAGHEEGDGTKENPINFLLGMDCEKGKYYFFNGNTYLALMDMKPCVWEPGAAGTHTVWQEA